MKEERKEGWQDGGLEESGKVRYVKLIHLYLCFMCYCDLFSIYFAPKLSSLFTIFPCAM